MNDKIKRLRQMYMSKQKILCTGNPDNPNTIAAGIRNLFPEATFVSRSSGYDLNFSDPINEEKFCNILKKHNILINASYIDLTCQTQILTVANRTWTHGHVINIGSVAEYDPDNYSNIKYAYDKLALRNLSLKLFTYRFRTSHIVLGGMKDAVHTDWLSPDVVAKTIKWILESPVDIPIIGIQQEFEAW